VLVTVIVLSFPRTSNVSSNRARVFTEPPVLAAEPDKTHAGASAGLREGLPEPLTVLRLGPPPMPACSPRSTKPIESMIEICREHAKNVKNWRDGQVALRPAVAGMLEAGKQFRRVNGHRTPSARCRSSTETRDKLPITDSGATCHRAFLLEPVSERRRGEDHSHRPTGSARSCIPPPCWRTCFSTCSG
jgi:hypothetical protein